MTDLFCKPTTEHTYTFGVVKPSYVDPVNGVQPVESLLTPATFALMNASNYIEYSPTDFARWRDSDGNIFGTHAYEQALWVLLYTTWAYRFAKDADVTDVNFTGTGDGAFIAELVRPMLA